MNPRNTMTRAGLALGVVGLLTAGVLFWRGSGPEPGEPGRTATGVQPKGALLPAAPAAQTPAVPNPTPRGQGPLGADSRASGEAEETTPPGDPRRAELQPSSTAPDPHEKNRDDKAPSPTRRIGRDAFDDRGLETLGMEPAEIDRIYGIWAEPVPGEINWATDDAERAQRARELTPDQEDAMRARMGDAGYDAMLYATGKNNRLLVTDVPEGTPGWDAGLQPGDQILYLDDERIFDRSALNWKEAGLPRSGSVPLVVLREGEWVELTVEGGRVRAKLIGGLFPPYRP